MTVEQSRHRYYLTISLYKLHSDEDMYLLSVCNTCSLLYNSQASSTVIESTVHYAAFSFRGAISGCVEECCDFL